VEQMSDDNQIKIRLPDDVMSRLHASIRITLRTIPMEITWRLRKSFEAEDLGPPGTKEGPRRA
jgi:hypothetical protein